MEISDLKTELERTGTLVYPNRGVSMMPLIRQGKDLMIIKSRGKTPLKLGDAVLFTRGRDYVLHRIVDIVSDGYLICGDNQKTAEHVFDSQIIGILTGVIRDGKEISVDDRDYRRYVKLVLKYRQPLQNIKALASMGKRAVKKIAGKK